jgi:hypothetical protein
LRSMTKHFLVILFIAVSLNSQTISNLSYFNSFVDSSINLMAPHFEKGDSLFLNYESESGQVYFLNHIQTLLSKKGLRLVFQPDKAGLYLNYRIEKSGVDYSQVLKKEFLEDYFIERKIDYAGTFSLQNRNKVLETKQFNFTAKDTIDYNDVPGVENSQYKFTQAEVPAEPFWESILEPAVAVGAIILTVILLFTVRSK